METLSVLLDKMSVRMAGSSLEDKNTLSLIGGAVVDIFFCDLPMLTRTYYNPILNTY